MRKDQPIVIKNEMGQHSKMEHWSDESLVEMNNGQNLHLTRSDMKINSSTDQWIKESTDKNFNRKKRNIFEIMMRIAHWIGYCDWETKFYYNH